MRAGTLRHSIEIQHVVETQDSTGAVVETWQTFSQRRASYEPMTAKEQFSSQQQHAHQTARFKLRYVAGVTPKMRIVFDSRVFDIQSVIDPYGRKRELELVAVEDV